MLAIACVLNGGSQRISIGPDNTYVLPEGCSASYGYCANNRFRPLHERLVLTNESRRGIINFLPVIQDSLRRWTVGQVA